MMLSEFNTEHFVFRNYIELSEDESFLIWKGRNHPEIRKWMDNPDEFSFEQHLKYVDSLKEREDRMYFAAIYMGNVIGSFCLNPYDKYTKKGEQGKYLFVDYIGKGLGKLSTREFMSYLFKNEVVNRIEIRTLLNNTRNQHVNESVGFCEYKRDEKYVYMFVEQSCM